MVEKYRRIAFKILMIIPCLISLFFLDVWILPQKSINDTIVSYSEKKITRKGRYSRSGSELMGCYKFYTQNGHQFSTENKFIDENEVTIEYSYIFKIVTSVKSQYGDYSNNLISGLKGLNLFFIQGLLISTISSLLILRYKKKLPENSFQNIILLNSFLVFVLLYFLAFQN